MRRSTRRPAPPGHAHIPLPPKRMHECSILIAAMLRRWGRPRLVVSHHGRRACLRSLTPGKDWRRSRWRRGRGGSLRRHPARFGVYHASNLLCAVTWTVKPWSVVRRSTKKPRRRHSRRSCQGARRCGFLPLGCARLPPPSAFPGRLGPALRRPRANPSTIVRRSCLPSLAASCQH